MRIANFVKFEMWQKFLYIGDTGFISTALMLWRHPTANELLDLLDLVLFFCFQFLGFDSQILNFGSLQIRLWIEAHVIQCHYLFKN